MVAAYLGIKPEKKQYCDVADFARIASAAGIPITIEQRPQPPINSNSR